MNIDVHKKIVSLYEQLIQSNEKLIEIETIKSSKNENFNERSLVNNLFETLDVLFRKLIYHLNSKNHELSETDLEELELQIANIKNKVNSLKG